MELSLDFPPAGFDIVGLGAMGSVMVMVQVQKSQVREGMLPERIPGTSLITGIMLKEYPYFYTLKTQAGENSENRGH